MGSVPWLRPMKHRQNELHVLVWIWGKSHSTVVYHNDRKRSDSAYL